MTHHSLSNVTPHLLPTSPTAVNRRPSRVESTLGPGWYDSTGDLRRGLSIVESDDAISQAEWLSAMERLSASSSRSTGS